MDMVMGYFGLSSILSSNYVASSLNLLAFYMIWATLILSQPPLRVELLGSILVRLIFYWFPTLIFTLFDALMPGLSSDLKTRRGKHVSWRDKGWIAANATMNMGIATGIQAVVQFVNAQLLMRKKPVFNVGTTLPFPWTVVTDILLLLSTREALTYAIHRYPKTAPFALRAHYAHPLDYFLLQFLPLYLPAYIRRVHLLTFFLLLAIVSLESALIYSGYDIFWGLLGGTVRRIDRHYSPGGEKGDFGIWGIIDWVEGTAGGRSRPEEEGGAIDVHEEVHREVSKQKKRLKKRLNS